MTMYCDEAMLRKHGDRGRLCLWLTRLYIAGCIPLDGQVSDASIICGFCSVSLCVGVCS